MQGLGSSYQPNPPKKTAFPMIAEEGIESKERQTSPDLWAARRALPVATRMRAEQKQVPTQRGCEGIHDAETRRKRSSEGAPRRAAPRAPIRKTYHYRSVGLHTTPRAPFPAEAHRPRSRRPQERAGHTCDKNALPLAIRRNHRESGFNRFILDTYSCT